MITLLKQDDEEKQIFLKKKIQKEPQQPSNKIMNEIILKQIFGTKCGWRPEESISTSYGTSAVLAIKHIKRMFLWFPLLGVPHTMKCLFNVHPQ